MTPAEYLETYHGIKPMCGCTIEAGWFPLVRALVVALERRGFRGEQVDQIKQKFAGLRFYTSSHDDYVDRIIRVAEVASRDTCETCGMDGRQRSSKGWFYVGCDACDVTAPGTDP